MFVFLSLNVFLTFYAISNIFRKKIFGGGGVKMWAEGLIFVENFIFISRFMLFPI